jgi:hypothetical protein
MDDKQMHEDVAKRIIFEALEGAEIKLMNAGYVLSSEWEQAACRAAEILLRFMRVSPWEERPPAGH